MLGMPCSRVTATWQATPAKICWSSLKTIYNIFCNLNIQIGLSGVGALPGCAPELGNPKAPGMVAVGPQTPTWGPCYCNLPAAMAKPNTEEAMGLLDRTCCHCCSSLPKAAPNTKAVVGSPGQSCRKGQGPQEQSAPPGPLKRPVPRQTQHAQEPGRAACGCHQAPSQPGRLSQAQAMAHQTSCSCHHSKRFQGLRPS